LNQGCLPEELHHAVDGILGREWSTDLDKLSMKGIKRWNQGWDLGHNNFLLKNMSNYEVITKEYASVLDKVLLNTPISSITYGEDQKCVVKDKSGRSYTSDLVVVTVPISQLKKGAIQFVPDLPEIKKKELQKISMEPAMKMMLKFKERPWAEDLGNLVTTGHLTLAWPSSTDNKSKTCHVLTCLITGQVAAKLSNMSQRDSVNIVLEDMKRVYGEQIEKNFENFVIQDWTKEEYIEGGYTFPNVNEDENTRKILAEPISNKIFFAGEGVSSYFGPISGAIDSSFKAFEKICELIPQ
jgi:monoamine oxidase